MTAPILSADEVEEAVCGVAELGATCEALRAQLDAVTKQRDEWLSGLRDAVERSLESAGERHYISFGHAIGRLAASRDEARAQLAASEARAARLRAALVAAKAEFLSLLVGLGPVVAFKLALADNDWIPWATLTVETTTSTLETIETALAEPAKVTP